MTGIRSAMLGLREVGSPAADNQASRPYPLQPPPTAEQADERPHRVSLTAEVPNDSDGSQSGRELHNAQVAGAAALITCPHCVSRFNVEMLLCAPGADEKGTEQSPTEPHPSPEIGSKDFVPVTLKEKVWLMVEITQTTLHPYQLVSRLMSGLGLVFIVISVVNFAVETMPQYYERQPTEVFIIEATCIGYFSLELLVRSLAAPDFKAYIKDKFTVIDILSILPFYIGLIVGGGAAKGLLIVRILRLMRVFRVFKVSKYNDAINVVFGSLRKSTEGLYLLLFLILLSMLIFSSAIYFAEREASTYDYSERRWYRSSYNGTYRARSPYQSIFHSFWWCLVTLTTVGYGDEVPVSTAGKLVAACTMLCGTLVIAFPMVIIGQNFQDMYATHRARKESRCNRNVLSRGYKAEPPERYLRQTESPTNTLMLASCSKTPRMVSGPSSEREMDNKAPPAYPSHDLLESVETRLRILEKKIDALVNKDCTAAGALLTLIQSNGISLMNGASDPCHHIPAGRGECDESEHNSELT